MEKRTKATSSSTDQESFYIVSPLIRMLKSRGYHVKDHRADNLLMINLRVLKGVKGIGVLK
jgi:hypothetical protein